LATVLIAYAHTEYVALICQINTFVVDYKNFEYFFPTTAAVIFQKQQIYDFYSSWHFNSPIL